MLAVAAIAQAHVFTAQASHATERSSLSELRLQLATERLEAIRAQTADLDGLGTPAS